MHALKKNTIFFLGAGFSKEAGAPLQSELLEKVLTYTGNDYGNTVKKYKRNINNFLSDAFNIKAENPNRKRFSLEDFYTPIDKCISENVSFRGYSVNSIKQIRNQLSTLVSIVIDAELVNSTEDTDYLDSFTEYIIENSKGSKENKPTIISTNWDILLDRRVYQSINNTDAVDLGTHVFGFGEKKSDQLLPPMTAKTRGGSTVKLFKIHGSLNWLKCPSCNRLFVKPDLKIAILEHGLDHNCRFCIEKFSLPKGEVDGLKLVPQIIYPTFLKELNNIHFSNIWHTTAREISNAKQIVFIGYSFQQADFEIRQLLARFLPDDCKVICVSNSPRLTPEDADYSRSTVSRYESFFGGREFQYFEGGASHFIMNNIRDL